MPPTLLETQSDSARATLDQLARELQSLPIASLAPAIVLLLAGLLLLIAGRHFLRPVLVVVTVLLGAMLGPSVLGAVLPAAPAIFLAFVGGLSGLVFVAIAWRVVLGAATGVVSAFACAFVAMLLIDAGAIDARSATGMDRATAAHAAAADDAARASDEELHRTVVENAPALVHPLVEWADSRWRAESPQVRVLLKAAAAGGGFVGLVVGIWLPQQAAAFLTSLVGAIFALVGAMPFVARVSDRAADGIPPVAWLCLWMSLALAGWLWQSAQGQRRSAGQDADGRGARGSAEQRAEND